MESKKNSDVKITVQITNPDGSVIERTFEKTGALLAPEEINLTERDEFLDGFSVLEQTMIEMRDQMTKGVAAAYLSDASKKNGTKHNGLCKRKSCVDSEIGRISVEVRGQLAAGLKPKERIRSYGMDELQLRMASEMSFRNTADLMNRIMHIEGNGMKASTLCEYVEGRGAQIDEKLSKATADVFRSIYPEGDGSCPSQDQLAEMFAGDDTAPVGSAWNIFQEEIHAFNELVNQSEDNSAQKKPLEKRILEADRVNKLELDPLRCVYISADDVGVKSQKETRGPEGKKSQDTVQHTVIHIEAGGQTYRITAVGMHKAFERVLAFLIGNDLIRGRQIVFLVDGATTLYSAIQRWFSFAPCFIILDWYHLEKRMYQLLSMAIRGGKTNKEWKDSFRKKINGILWAGNVDLAIDELGKVDAKRINNKEKLDEAIAYLKRKDPWITCYALRAQLHWRNSSNRGEKSNDQLVATRQKHNGMSWSRPGSGALAAVRALRTNHEFDGFIKRNEIRFSFGTEMKKCA